MKRTRRTTCRYAVVTQSVATVPSLHYSLALHSVIVAVRTYISQDDAQASDSEAAAGGSVYVPETQEDNNDVSNKQCRNVAVAEFKQSAYP